MTLETDCAKCGIKLTLPNCDREGYEAFDMKRFMDRILCQRCNKYYRRSKWLADKIHKLSLRMFLYSHRSDAHQIKDQIRLDLIPIVAEFLANASQYYKVTPFPAAELADEIVNQPDCWAKVLRTAASSMAERSTEIHTQNNVERYD